VILVGPEGQVVRYDGQAIPRGEALRAFLAHGWRPGGRKAAAADSRNGASERLDRDGRPPLR
jgi:hypothetical protein